jgi:hypothetical protein
MSHRPRSPEDEDKLRAKLLERLDLSSLVDEVLGELREQLQERVDEQLAIMLDEGICSYSFHRPISEFRDDGTCQCCGKPHDVHEAVFVCDEADLAGAAEAEEKALVASIMGDKPERADEE